MSSRRCVLTSIQVDAGGRITSVRPLADISHAIEPAPVFSSLSSHFSACHQPRTYGTSVQHNARWRRPRRHCPAQKIVNAEATEYGGKYDRQSSALGQRGNADLGKYTLECSTKGQGVGSMTVPAQPEKSPAFPKQKLPEMCL